MLSKYEIECQMLLSTAAWGLEAKATAQVPMSPSFILPNHLLGDLSFGCLGSSNE
jgi:hypothetical protein